MEGESGVSPSIICEPQSSDIERDQIEGEICFTRSIIGEILSSYIQGDQI